MTQHRTILLNGYGLCPVCKGRPMELTSLLTGVTVRVPCPSWFHGRDVRWPTREGRAS
jgi:hypothetical protein